MKKAPSYLAVALIIGVLLAGNLLALFLFREQATFTVYSLAPTVTAATVTLWGGPCRSFSSQAQLPCIPPPRL